MRDALILVAVWTGPAWLCAAGILIDQWLDRRRKRKQPQIIVTFGGRERTLWERHRRVG